MSTLSSSVKPLSSISLSRQYMYDSFHDGVLFTTQEVFSKDNHYTLFRYEDWPMWVIFSVTFAFLIALDNLVLNRNPKALTVSRAIIYTLFWVMCAFAFSGWIWSWKGQSGAFMWMSGYMLEWMLSFDNLFVFHMIFSVYATPDHLKHRPLYLGIIGAVFFRLIFIFIGEYLMHAMYFMHLVFGAFLVYTGIKTMSADDEDDDPSQHPVMQWLQRNFPFVPVYDERGSFFVKVPVGAAGDAIIHQARHSPSRRTTENDPIINFEAGAQEAPRYGSVDFAAVNVGDRRQYEWRATMLFLVVCCIEMSDLLFAVDSVSAIVAQVNDLYLAYTSAVFAMLGLRATFFIIDVLVRLFSLLKYGVAAVLIFIGIKLIIGNMYHIPPGVVCVVLVSAIASSMIASWIQDEVQKKVEGKMAGDVENRMAKVKDTINTPEPPLAKQPVAAA